MMIETIKIQGDGYLVNSNLSVPKADGNRHYGEVKLAIAGDNDDYPTAIEVEPEFSQGELDQQAIDDNNAPILAEIATLEVALARPIRELLSTTTAGVDKEYAQGKVDNIEAQIIALRGNLL